MVKKGEDLRVDATSQEKEARSCLVVVGFISWLPWVTKRELFCENPMKRWTANTLQVLSRHVLTWARVRGYLESSHEIRVNFSANHNTYYSAYKYVTKDDKYCVLSNAHPELRDPPTTENAIAARKAQRRGKKGKRKRSERYSTFDVVEVIQHHSITTSLRDSSWCAWL
ncbi:hypothetical protein QZH41_018282 [Actinostola sp. cb2023]|nr:hypothetical protein QZH41_018282 [Actinostola sp. cb2023]